MMDNYHNIGTSTDWIIMLVYFLIVLAFGSYFGRYNKDTNDFFFGGRRFSWWLIAFSIVATGVGSHSFIKYSAMGFQNGFSSSMTYMNDWFFLPFFLFGWLPIIVYTKIRSIPEYFEKRFNKTARFIATFLLMIYMIGYISIGFLTLGKAALPLLPEHFTLFGNTYDVTLMGVVIIIAIITGFYITFGGQTAVIFTDLLQGFILIFAGLFLFFLGIDYLGGFNVFWNALPTEWKLPLANFNEPSSFNFVGIFWQDGIAGSIGFLFMNMGLIMRFMATKSVNEGRKAAAFNVLFMLPISAIVVSNAGWLGKAISVINPEAISPNTNPDQIFVVVANLVSHPGVFGFIMAALTAALMSTVDTLINATAAVYINDIHRPIKHYIKSKFIDKRTEDRKELSAARIASMIITIGGVIGVLVFKDFPTVYEAHGFFHSTLTPPLVVAIFFGAFWKKFNSTAVITTFVVGVVLMILGSMFPYELITPFAHGTPFDPKYPYTYIGALYNMFVCAGVGVIIVATKDLQRAAALKLKLNYYGALIVELMIFASLLIFIVIVSKLLSIIFLVLLALILLVFVSLIAEFYSTYDDTDNIEGLTVWGVKLAKERFKGGPLNEEEGEHVIVDWKILENSNSDDYIYFSKEDMKKMKANTGDLVYLTDARSYLGGLKSIHSIYGEPHDEPGVVYITQFQSEHGVFVEGKKLKAEKEM